MSARTPAAARTLVLALGLSLVVAGSAGAMPASPVPFEVRQPDGSTLRVRLMGDEWLHWYEDEAGELIVEQGGAWRYADLDARGRVVATPHVVGRIDPRGVGLRQGRRPVLDGAVRLERDAAHTPAALPGGVQVGPSGTVKNLVVLCLFSDHTIAVNGRAPSAYDSLFNQVNSTGINAPTGSVRDFYAQASYGTLTLQSTVLTWVTLPQTEAYYGNGKYGLPFGSDPSPYPTNAARMVRDALDLADAQVNFRDFDQDNDGYVDAITIIHSGYAGEQPGNGTNAIWSHKINLSAENAGGSAWVSAEKNANNVNVKVDLYHTEAARWGTSGAGLLRVGVVAHELGHYFGLPDLYDTDGSSFGIGSWCLMANSWGWDVSQRYPPLPSAWCRIQLGWVTPIQPFLPGIVSLAQVVTNAQVAKITAGMPPNEYLLVENRQPVGFDRDIPQGGLAIWHVDDNVGANTMEGFLRQPGWPGNGNHYRVALLQADSLFHLEHNVNQGDAGDLFRDVPGIALSELTMPASDAYRLGSSYPTGVEISQVSVSGATMSFRFRPATWCDVSYFTPPYAGTYPQPYFLLGQALNAAGADGIVISKGGTITGITELAQPVTIKSYGGVTTLTP